MFFQITLFLSLCNASFDTPDRERVDSTTDNQSFEAMLKRINTKIQYEEHNPKKLAEKPTMTKFPTEIPDFIKSYDLTQATEKAKEYVDKMFNDLKVVKHLPGVNPEQELRSRIEAFAEKYNMQQKSASALLYDMGNLLEITLPTDSPKAYRRAVAEGLVKFYTMDSSEGGPYKIINDALFRNSINGEFMAVLNGFLILHDNGIFKIHEQETEFFKGAVKISEEQWKQFNEMWDTKQEFYWPSFLSTSVKDDLAREFGKKSQDENHFHDPESVFFQIIAKKNILGLAIDEKLTHFPKEFERLFFPYHKMKVTNINSHRESTKFVGRGKVTLECLGFPALIEHEATSSRHNSKPPAQNQPEEEKEPEETSITRLHVRKRLRSGYMKAKSVTRMQGGKFREDMRHRRGAMKENMKNLLAEHENIASFMSQAHSFLECEHVQYVLCVTAVSAVALKYCPTISAIGGGWYLGEKLAKTEKVREIKDYRRDLNFESTPLLIQEARKWVKNNANTACMCASACVAFTMAFPKEAILPLLTGLGTFACTVHFSTGTQALNSAVTGQT